MGQTDIDDLVERLESHRRELLRQVREMTEEETGRRPSEQEWSVKEQLVHLAAFERLWLEWAMKVRDEPGCEVGPPPPNPPACADASARPVADLVRELVSVRSDTIAAIQGLTEDDLTKRGNHVLFGEMSVLQMLRSPYRHDRMHIDQIAGREPSFRPRLTRPEDVATWR